MSAPLAGKFQDHYEVLGIDPKADTAAIQKAYSQLVKQQREENPSDQERLSALHQAYEILSDVQLRREFDKVKGVSEVDIPKFSGESFFSSLSNENNLRVALLCVLYDRRRSRPTRPSLSVRHLETLIAADGERIFFVLWYLKQRNFAMSDDKSSLQITVEGMDFLEKLQPAAEDIMPFIRSEAAVEPGAELPLEELEDEQGIGTDEMGEAVAEDAVVQEVAAVYEDVYNGAAFYEEDIWPAETEGGDAALESSTRYSDGALNDEDFANIS